MKKSFIKGLSIFISVSILISIAVFVPANADSDNAGTDIPLIYVKGQGTNIYKINEKGEKQTIYPVNMPTGDLIKVATENLDVFAKALATQEWTDFGNLVRDTISPYYSELALDENGEAPNGSTCDWNYSKASLNTAKINGKYQTEQFTFVYDWRMDPYKVAEDLHQYIEDVMDVTGSDHIVLSGRCLGACVAAAYMDKYDGEHVSDLILYCSALNGATVCSKMFAGDIYLDADAVERLFYDMQLSADQLINELLQAFVTVFNDTYGLDLTCWAFNNVWEDIYLDIMPQILIDSFGTWPGYWSMVSDRDYERAKANVFHGQDMEKWSNFIDIIDNYHYNIQVKAPEIFKEYEEKGIAISNITKYGFQSKPVLKNAEELSDYDCLVSDVSMGATTAGLNSTLSDDYISSLETKKYISPDKQIDASKCLFPERTWFIKNLKHNVFPGEVNRLIDSIANNHGMTIYSDINYPQYLVYDNDNHTLYAMTSRNCNTTERYNITFWDALETLIKKLYELIKRTILNNVIS